MFATWLLPDKKDEEYLMKIIKELSKKFNAPMFLPHITIYGLVDIKIHDLKNIINSSIENSKPFNVSLQSIDYSDNMWKSVFINLILNRELKEMNSNLSKTLKRYGTYNFAPHFSLIYKNLEDSEKLEIIQEIKIKNQFDIDRVAILNFSEDVNKWEIVSIYQL